MLSKQKKQFDFLKQAQDIYKEFKRKYYSLAYKQTQYTTVYSDQKDDRSIERQSSSEIGLFYEKGIFPKPRSYVEEKERLNLGSSMSPLSSFFSFIRQHLNTIEAQRQDLVSAIETCLITIEHNEQEHPIKYQPLHNNTADLKSRIANINFQIAKLQSKHTFARKINALFYSNPQQEQANRELYAIDLFRQLKGVQAISEKMHKHYYALCLAPVIQQLETEIIELQSVLKAQGTRADDRYTHLTQAITKAKSLLKNLKDISQGKGLPLEIDVCNRDLVMEYTKYRIDKRTKDIFQTAQTDFNHSYDQYLEKVESSLDSVKKEVRLAFFVESEKWLEGDFVSGAAVFNTNKKNQIKQEMAIAREFNVVADFLQADNTQIRIIAIRNLIDLAMEAAKNVFEHPDFQDRAFVRDLQPSCHPLSKDFNSDRFIHMLTSPSAPAVDSDLNNRIVEEMASLYLKESMPKDQWLSFSQGYQKEPNNPSYQVYLENLTFLKNHLKELHAYAHPGDLDKAEWERGKENAAIAKDYVQHVYKQIKAKSQGKTFDAGHYKMYRVAGMDHHNALNLADYDRNINAILKSFEQGSWERDFSVEGQHKAAEYDATIRTELQKALRKRSEMLTKSGVALRDQPDFVCSAGSFATFELTGRRIKMSDLGSLDDTADYKPTVMQSVVRSLHRAVLNLFDTLNALKIWVSGKDSGLTCNQIGRVLGHVKNYQLSRLPTRDDEQIASLEGKTLQHQQHLAQTSASLLSKKIHKKDNHDAPRNTGSVLH